MAVLLSKEWGYKMQERKLKYAAPYVFMVLPALILFVVFFIIPLIYTVTYSFFNWTNYSADITFAGLQNYKTWGMVFCR